MKVGFKINLKNYEVLSVESSEQKDGFAALKELYEFLKQFDHPEINRFRKAFYGSRVKPEAESEEKPENKPKKKE